MVHIQEQRWGTTARCLVDHLAPGGVAPGNPTSKTREIPTLLIPGEWQEGDSHRRYLGGMVRLWEGSATTAAPLGSRSAISVGNGQGKGKVAISPTPTGSTGRRTLPESEIEKTLNAKVFMENQMQSLGKLG